MERALILAAAAIHIFSPITQVIIANCNRDLMRKGQTTILHYQYQYINVQIKLQETECKIPHNTDTTNHNYSETCQ